ncbi:MAG: hypothetical protein L3J82_09440 [Planctomycetes bacterium]|nr:hypothetical protein [Planctomycetota bacterium]
MIKWAAHELPVRDNNLSRKAPYGRYDDDVLLRVIEYDVVDNNDNLSSFLLVTTVTDCNKLPARQAAHGYNLRWRVEVGIRELKWMKKLVHPTFNGMSPEIVEQEFEAMLLAHACIRLLMALTAKKHGQEP